MLDSLGYLGVASADVPAWSEFATQLLGMHVAERTAATLALRMDERAQRLFIDAAAAPSCPSCYIFGWEVADAATLDALAATLDAAGVAVKNESAALAARRGVQALISFADPVGNRLEAFFGPAILLEPFRPTRAISGFRTGALGLGHVVLTVERIDAVAPFYQRLLGFRLSDYTFAPFKAFFYHINSRHHSLALIETGTNGLHHLMVELKSLDDVGQAYDIAQSDQDRVGVTLGRHSNDFMTSFYAKSPSPFLLEYGWGGRNIDIAAWTPEEYTCGPSLWGHERSWLAPDKILEARALRLKAAELGHRAPVHVLEGNYTLMRS
jgi:2,3-dihydroxybiphenyl 1,2-dioxygenase